MKCPNDHMIRPGPTPNKARGGIIATVMTVPTSVLVHGLFDPLLHVADFQGTSLLHGFGVQRVVAA